MLISHEYKFIFIKTKKTAGTSIEVELSKLMGPQDVVTPINPHEIGHEQRNFRPTGPINRLLRRKYYNHMPATKVRKLVGAATFDNYFKFCVEREPVSKCISLYSMQKNSPDHQSTGGQLSWEDYVDRGHFPLDHDKYLDENGNLMVDRIVKYEKLHAELTDIGEQLGFQFGQPKTRAKSGFREEITVTDAQRARIYDAFSASVAHTGYTL